MRARVPFAPVLLLGVTLIAWRSLAQTTYEPYTFTTLAGGGGYSTNVAGTAARLLPLSVAVDSAGNIFVAEQGNNTIAKVSPSGVVTTLAGQPGRFGSANGTGSAARFNNPSGVALDNAGNVYVADTSNHTIRKVTPAGVVTTLAGQALNPGSANGTGSAARFNAPFGVAVDSAGNVYVADTDNHTIRKVTAMGAVTTLAGLAGTPGGADGTNRNALFKYPNWLTVDSETNIYVADTFNHTVRKMTPAGTNWVVTTLAGLADTRGSADGTNSEARFSEPNGVAVDSSGNLYVADLANNTIRKVTPDGTNWVVTTVAGLAGSFGRVDGTNSNARFNIPGNLAVDRVGNIYVADIFNSSIRKMTPAGTNWVVTTFTGLGGNYGSVEATGIAARFYGPSGVAVDSSGNVYVADQINQTIRKTATNGMVTTLAGLPGYGGVSDGPGNDARFGNPSGIAVDTAGNLYVADTLNCTIRRVTPAGVVTTLAGLAGAPGGDDGANSQARFLFPLGITVDNAGNLYVADTGAYTIRKVTPVGDDWVVTTLAGHFDQYTVNYGTINGVGTNAYFNLPSSVAVDSTGNVFVADTWNHAIRKITPEKRVTTLAGLAGSPGNADGMGSAARFNYPSGVAVDKAGNVFVTDAYNNTIRKVTPAGMVTTLSGMSGFYGTADGAGSDARFGNPTGLALDTGGNIYVADFYFNTIRKGTPATTLLHSGRELTGEFGFALVGPLGRAVVIEASNELLTWRPIWTNALTPDLKFSDPQSANDVHRFYRARLP